MGYSSILSAAPFELKLVDFGGIMLTELMGLVGLVGPVELAELAELVELVEGPVELAELDLIDSSAKTYGYHLNEDSFLLVLFY